jgi:hypothetical protein
MLENFSTKRRRQNTSSEESYAGPACINPQLPTTPLSPARTRQRRTQGSSLDAVSDGEIYEEDYRTGGPHLCRLPAVNGHLKNDSPTLSIWKNNLEDTVRDILSKFAVRFTTVALLHRQSRHDQEHNPTEDLTILVIAVKEMMDNKWYSACVEIRSACLDAGLGSMNVEIADERGLQPTLSHPISAHEPFAVQWYQIRPRVIALLGRQTWLSISLLRRGTSEDDRECPVTIVITIPEDSDSLWSGARDSIAAMLDSEGWYEVAVEIGRGSIWRGPQGTSAVRNRYLLEPERDWKTAAQMGRSVGRRDTSKTSGTLGGFIEILSSDTDEWKRYGLTCFQCVLPPSGESIPHREDLEKHGIQDGAHGIEMDQPSSGDHQETLRFHQEGIDDLRAQIHKLTELTLKDPDDSTTADRKRSIKKDQRTIESIEEKMELGREYFRQNRQHLGTVFAGSSSRRGENGCTLDWALIEVKPERVSSNKVSIYSRLSEQATGYTNSWQASSVRRAEGRCQERVCHQVNGCWFQAVQSCGEKSGRRSGPGNIRPELVQVWKYYRLYLGKAEWRPRMPA